MDKIKKMSIGDLKNLIEETVGQVYDWTVSSRAIAFRMHNTLNLKTLNALSEALGTDQINFDFGYSGEPYYSELTPGSDGEPGWVEVLLECE